MTKSTIDRRLKIYFNLIFNWILENIYIGKYQRKLMHYGNHIKYENN